MVKKLTYTINVTRGRNPTLKGNKEYQDWRLHSVVLCELQIYLPSNVDARNLWGF